MRRNDDGRFVARLGLEHSYTRQTHEIRVWSTKEDAMREACGNEHPVELMRAFADIGLVVMTGDPR